MPSPSKNILLGDIENSPSNDAEQSEIPPSIDSPSKSRRHKGLGNGSIQWKTITLMFAAESDRRNIVLLLLDRVVVLVSAIAIPMGRLC
ncbi:hypothetical protein LC653_24780 [Nostoc sp. CHAB 5784]|nr:hypothetical protein [Nostoc mirabile CHAB5784]